jgi:hypothetical protein
MVICLVQVCLRVDELDGLKHQQNEKHQFSSFCHDRVDSVNNNVVQKRVRVSGEEDKDKENGQKKRKISLNHCFKSLF